MSNSTPAMDIPMKRFYSKTYELKSGYSIELVWRSIDGITCSSREAYLLNGYGGMTEDLTPYIKHLRSVTPIGNILISLRSTLKKKGII